MRKSNKKIICGIKTFILVDEVEDKYKSRPADFTRNRKLPFQLLVIFMLRKLYKSLALEISEFFSQLDISRFSLTKSAFTQARQKLSPLFFRDLLQKFNQEFYTDNDQRVNRLKGMRILAVDGSTLDLPYSQELVQAYGTHSNQYESVRYVKGRVSVLYDLLNQMILDGVLQPFAEGEPVAALKHLAHCRAGDLVVYDRAYASFEMVYAHQASDLQVLMRMRPSFSQQLREFAQSDADDITVWMKPGKNTSIKYKAYGKDARVQVRLVKFNLDNGEQALLLTTLLDKQQFPIDFLKQIYGMRWRVETRYDVLKNVLQVEYFSGYTQKAIEQDFYISLFLMNMQALLAQELEEEIKSRYGHRKYAYQLNLALAIGHLKKSVVKLFISKQPDKILAQLKQSFLQHVEPIRPARKYPRIKDKYRNRKKPLLMKNRKNVL
jgi:hypothetical protein